MENGGLLLRFAGPRSAGHDGRSRPTRRRPADAGAAAGGGPAARRRAVLEPAGQAGRLPLQSPFAGLAVPDEVTVSRQVLAEPSAQLAAHTWARLADGTPLVTEATRGSGRVVLFHVTANADWSNLPLSGLFPDMLRRLVALSAGVSAAPDAPPLSPAETLDGFGVLGPPPPAASGLAGTAFATTVVSPQHPPGLYGPEAGRRALNLSNAMGRWSRRPVSGAAATGAERRRAGAGDRSLAGGGRAGDPGARPADRAAAARLAAAGSGRRCCWLAGPAQAQLAVAAVARRVGHAAGLRRVRRPGGGRDRACRARGPVGLRQQPHRGASGDPSGVQPGTDDLSFYPLLYWPVTQGQALSARRSRR